MQKFSFARLQVTWHEMEPRSSRLLFVSSLISFYGFLLYSLQHAKWFDFILHVIGDLWLYGYFLILLWGYINCLPSRHGTSALALGLQESTHSPASFCSFAHLFLVQQSRSKTSTRKVLLYGVMVSSWCIIMLTLWSEFFKINE